MPRSSTLEIPEHEVGEEGWEEDEELDPDEQELDFDEYEEDLEDEDGEDDI